MLNPAITSTFQTEHWTLSVRIFNSRFLQARGVDRYCRRSVFVTPRPNMIVCTASAWLAWHPTVILCGTLSRHVPLHHIFDFLGRFNSLLTVLRFRLSIFVLNSLALTFVVAFATGFGITPTVFLHVSLASTLTAHHTRAGNRGTLSCSQQQQDRARSPLVQSVKKTVSVVATAPRVTPRATLGPWECAVAQVPTCEKQKAHQSGSLHVRKNKAPSMSGGMIRVWLHSDSK